MILKLRHALAANANANPQDVLAAKTFLQDQGFYHSPDWGLSQFPDRAMFDGLKAFQKSNGLRVDGVMNPGGESEAATQRLQAHALNLQSLGRNGDTILAHITPAEAQVLKAKGGAGTTNPKTGLLEFFKADKNADTKKGKYTWHTVGDGNVRPSHAERNGKVYSWDSPPDDGHPGEAYNCRCTAEDVKSKDGKCKELKRLMDEAWDRHDKMQGKILDEEGKLYAQKQELEVVRNMRPEEFVSEEEYDGTESEYLIGRIGMDVLEKISRKKAREKHRRAIGLMIKREKISELNNLISETESKIKKLEQERKQRSKAAIEYSRRFNACQEKNGES